VNPHRWGWLITLQYLAPRSNVRRVAGSPVKRGTSPISGQLVDGGSVIDGIATAGAVSARRRAAVAVSAAAVLVLVIAGCSTGADAVAQGGTFEFVSPGGKTDISYDPPPKRGTVGVISGPDLMTDGKTTAVSDFPGQVVVINMWG
jgi:hypothetical protein